MFYISSFLQSSRFFERVSFGVMASRLGQAERADANPKYRQNNQKEWMTQYRDKDLSDQIVYLLKESSFDSEEFVPEGEIRRTGLLTREAVAKTLGFNSKDPIAESKSLFDFVSERATKTFIISVSCGMEGETLREGLASLMNENDRALEFNDKNLPIKNPKQNPRQNDESSESDEDTGDDQREPDKRGDGGEYYNRDNERNQAPVIAADQSSEVYDMSTRSPVWKMSRVYEFYKKQWQFLSPVFKTSQSNYDLDEHAILPLNKRGSTKEGAFGVVYKVKIHDGHYEDTEELVRPTQRFQSALSGN